MVRLSCDAICLEHKSLAVSDGERESDDQKTGSNLINRYSYLFEGKIKEEFLNETPCGETKIIGGHLKGHLRV